MLILMRRVGEALVIGDDLKIVVTGLNSDKAFLEVADVAGDAVSVPVNRKTQQSLVLFDDAVIHILEINGNQVKIGIEAPRSVSVHREEIYNKIQKEKFAA